MAPPLVPTFFVFVSEILFCVKKDPCEKVVQIQRVFRFRREVTLDPMKKLDPLTSNFSSIFNFNLFGGEWVLLKKNVGPIL